MNDLLALGIFRPTAALTASTPIATSPAEKRSTVQVCHVTNGGAPLRNTYNELRLRGETWSFGNFRCA
jgi:hypothetical protein